MRHSRGYVISFLQGLEKGLRGGSRVSNTVDPKKHEFSVMENSIEDVKQDEQHVPDLVESIMRPTCLAEEDLRPISFRMTQISSKIQEVRVSTVWILEFRCFLAGGQCQPPH